MQSASCRKARRPCRPLRWFGFRPDGFARENGPKEFRIFCLGGSTVQGSPFAIETAFSTWLELSLQAAEPKRQWDVVNCGGVSYASYRLVPILEEVLGYEPDLIILYTGHNEFLEDRPELESEVDAMLEYRGGLEQYHHHRDGLTPEELKRWKALVAEAAEYQSTSMYQATIVLEEALKIDDQHAGLHYLAAKCYDALGRSDQARRSYLNAKELDICPLVDVRKLYEDLSDSGIPGGYLLLDHVRPSIPGHQGMEVAPIILVLLLLGVLVILGSSGAPAFIYPL